MKKYKDGEVIGNYMGIPIVCRYDCPADTIYLIDEDGFKLTQGRKKPYDKKDYQKIVKVVELKIGRKISVANQQK